MALNNRSGYSQISVVMKEERSPESNIQLKRLGSRWDRSWRYWHLRFRRLRGTPAAIARGLACGVFAGSFPLFGLQTIIGVLLAVIFRGNKLAAAAGTWISNPFTYVPIFVFNYKVGQLLLGLTETVPQESLQQNWQSWSTLMESGLDFIITLFLGCLVVGLICALLSYIISFRIIDRWHKLRKYRKIDR